MKEKLKLLSSIKYECYGYPMTGIFYSSKSIITIQSEKYFYYFRNSIDDRLKEIMDKYFDEPEDCLDWAIEKLKEFKYI